MKVRYNTQIWISKTQVILQPLSLVSCRIYVHHAYTLAKEKQRELSQIT